jgi:uncharacterized membrane protein
VRVREYLRVSLWPIPALLILAALTLAEGMLAIDYSTDSIDLIEGSTARDILSAIGGGMIAFIGFVFVAVLLAIQFGSQAFSPRLLRVLRADRALKVALGTFTATFLFALDILASIDPRNVPELSVFVAFLLLLASVVMFLVLVQRTSRDLRAASVIAKVGRHGRRAVARMQGSGDVPDPPGEDEEVREVRHEGTPGVIAAVHLDALARAARRAGARIELTRAVGDPVAGGGVVARVTPAETGLRDRAVLRALILADERTFAQDPGFALRILVDVAIKALSPAINDPTTAVQCLDQIQDLLGRLATRPLGPVGAESALLPAPGWEDYVALGLDEIRFYGAESSQVRARIEALVDELAPEVPAERRAALMARRTPG